jgi:hypothetical protein
VNARLEEIAGYAPDPTDTLRALDGLAAWRTAFGAYVQARRLKR